jgi:hypothetical protein
LPLFGEDGNLGLLLGDGAVLLVHVEQHVHRPVVGLAKSLVLTVDTSSAGHRRSSGGR